MRARDFVVVKRPTLAKITKYPTIGFVNYECRLESMQSVMQSIQQAYLGTRERAVVVLERRYRMNAADTTCNAFGKRSLTPGRSSFLIARGTGAF